jgi:apolipoprotein N-acyltransferase
VRNPGRLEIWAAHPWALPAVAGALYFVAHYGRLLAPNFVAFVPMLVWLDARRDAPPLATARGAVVFGVVAYGLGLHWIYAMLSISWLAVFMYLGLLVLFTCTSAAAFLLAAQARARLGWSWGVLLPVAWINFEWLRTWGDLRMTADHAAHGLAAFPFLVQFADLTGPYGVGAWILASNGLIWEASRRGPGARRRAAATVLAGLAVAVLAYDAWAWTHPPPVSKSVRVGVIQPNIPLLVKWDPGKDEAQERRLAELTREAVRRGAELVIWPESARPKSVRHWLSRPETLAMPEVQALAAETGADILAGVEYWRIREPGERNYYNAALVARRDGTVAPEWTAKVYLVPFTEGVPFRAFLGPLLDGLGGELHWLSGGFAPGEAPVPLPAAGLRVGVLVCYEELYFDLSRALRRQGADVQVVITNDAWFGRTVFQELLADVARMRAIETRSAFVRAANTGISGFIDPSGRFHRRTELFEEAVEVLDVPVTAGRTVYVRVGDLVAWVAVAVSAVALAATLVHSRRQRKA